MLEMFQVNHVQFLFALGSSQFHDEVLIFPCHHLFIFDLFYSLLCRILYHLVEIRKNQLHFMHPRSYQYQVLMPYGISDQKLTITIASCTNSSKTIIHVVKVVVSSKNHQKRFFNISSIVPTRACKVETRSRSTKLPISIRILWTLKGPTPMVRTRGSLCTL